MKPEDCVPEWHDLEDVYKTVLSEWYAFLSKRYNIVGKVRISSSDSANSASKAIFVFPVYLEAGRNGAVHFLRIGRLHT